MEKAEIDWSAITEWFGYKPRFHDSEVVSIELCRDPKPSILRLYAFRMNSDVDERGYFRLDLHALVSFKLSGITEAQIDDWNHQNALMSLEITDATEGYRLAMESAYGVDGYIVAKHIEITVEPWPVVEAI
jgi:hypothetical protein